jgi:hypothetical protein
MVLTRNPSLSREAERNHVQPLAQTLHAKHSRALSTGPSRQTSNALDSMVAASSASESDPGSASIHLPLLGDSPESRPQDPRVQTSEKRNTFECRTCHKRFPVRSKLKYSTPTPVRNLRLHEEGDIC